MRDWQSQSHVRWYCQYPIVCVPKYRRRVISGQLRRSIGRIIRDLCQQQGVELVEGHAMLDHVPLCLSIPPKDSVAHTVGWLKGKSAIRIPREFVGRERNRTGWHCWVVYLSPADNYFHIPSHLVVTFWASHNLLDISMGYPHGVS